MNSSVKNVLCLTIITVVAGLGLGYVYEITKEPIAQMEENTKLAAYRSVFPEAAGFTDVDTVPQSTVDGVDIDSAVSADDASGNKMGEEKLGALGRNKLPLRWWAFLT